MEIGAKLKKMRRGAGISQQLMADLLHISRSNVSRLENENIELKAVDLIKWCKITNNPDMLMVLYASIDVTSTLVNSGAMALITGFITTLGGIL
ncbi:helix-turn-helix transcriptional regulator [Oceanobacillus sp. FSL H7-0719]|uniref:helix-turn-helix domain-containing protein n=1 Tax=Oceanobacillus sp. FSL H7-0719 TaxID=2954507 RepID=UPI0032447AD4